MKSSLKQISKIVILGTLLSKFGGLLRQLVIAGTFGVSSAYNAYNYAYVLPGFFLILLGGINGPLHNSIISILSKEDKKEHEYIFASIRTIVSTFMLFITGILFIFADKIIQLIGPNLNTQTHQIAVIQLQIMAPIALISGLIGLGYGVLNSKDNFLIPSISPIISSSSIILMVGIFWYKEGGKVVSIDNSLEGGIIIASATLIGAFLQWTLQIPALVKGIRKSCGFIWDWKHPGVKAVLRVMGPASLASGMLQINVFTDLFFASGIAGAAAGLGYANFLIQTPLGLISNALLIPLLPTYARLAKEKDKVNLIIRIRQGFMLSSSSMIGLGSIFIALANPLVKLIYERGAFNQNASEMVTGLLIAYAIGMPFYLGRDLLVRVFYAIDDAKTPFKISTIGIFLNILFDWILLGGPTPWGDQFGFNFGVRGLVMATVAINFITCITLIFKLNLTISGIPLRRLFIDFLKLLSAGVATWLITSMIQSQSYWSNDFTGLTISMLASSIAGVAVFCFIGNSLGVKEVRDLILILKSKFILR